MNSKKNNNYHVEVLSVPPPRQRSRDLFSAIPFLSRFGSEGRHMLNNRLTLLTSATPLGGNLFNAQAPSATSSTLVAVRPHPSRILRGFSGNNHSDETGRRRLLSKNPKKPEKMAILVRSDVKLSTGRVIHFSTSIALRLFQRVCDRSNNLCASWTRAGQKKVVHPIQNDAKMNAIIRYARQYNIAVAGVRVKLPSSEKASANTRGRNRAGPSVTKSSRKHTFTVSNDKINDGRQDQQGDSKSKDGHEWVAIGLFGPTALVDKLTKNLPEI